MKFKWNGQRVLEEEVVAIVNMEEVAAAVIVHTEVVIVVVAVIDASTVVVLIGLETVLKEEMIDVSIVVVLIGLVIVQRNVGEVVAAAEVAEEDHLKEMETTMEEVADLHQEIDLVLQEDMDLHNVVEAAVVVVVATEAIKAKWEEETQVQDVVILHNVEEVVATVEMVEAEMVLNSMIELLQ